MIEELARIQQALYVPKGQNNDFSNFKYRSAADILSAVKPHLNGLVIRLTDEIELIGDRYYVASSAILASEKDSIISKAYAREEPAKKGMDAAQITGSASSYARKYALAALFAIDDGEDPDSQDNAQEQQVNFQDEFARITTAINAKDNALMKTTWSATSEVARNAIWKSLTSVQRETLNGAMK